MDKIISMTTNCQTSSPSAESTAPKNSFFINRMAYGAFVLVALYFFIFSEDKIYGVSQLGIALIFDPFDQSVTFSKRPLYQRVWLIVHASIAILGFVFMLWLGVK